MHHTIVRAADRWHYLVDLMLYRVYVVAWEWAEEEAKYINLDRRASVVASTSENPDYVAGDGPGKRRRSDAFPTVE